MFSFFKAPVRSYVIEVSAKWGESTGKGLIACTLRKWRHHHKGEKCSRGTWEGMCQAANIALCQGKKRLKMSSSLCCGWWLGRGEMMPNECRCVTLTYGGAASLCLCPLWYLGVIWLFSSGPLLPQVLNELFRIYSNRHQIRVSLYSALSVEHFKGLYVY